MNNRILLFLLAILCVANLQSSVFNYQSPVDYDISLAGNFGEPRPHHFHGGLDIRTDGVEGKHIYAIGDGYVSRITIGLYGFGNAVYITHPTGHTSVYCHLKAFSPRIKAALRRYQYSHETSVADARLTPLDVPVSAGQFIALSGNTGHSTAPHLHLEIHDTRTGNMLDPYQFLDEFIEDTVAPQIHAIMAIPQRHGIFNGTSANQPINISFLGEEHRAGYAWGSVGFAIWADDYMQGSYNHYGIHETLLYVDGKMAFHSVVDNIPVSMNRLVNSWGCYDHWLRHRTWYMKSYIEPGNTLPCLLADDRRGIINFCEARPYNLEYVLRDFKGNETRLPFTVQGQPDTVTSAASVGSSASASSVDCTSAAAKPAFLRSCRTISYSRPGMQLIVPYGYVVNDTPISLTVVRRPSDYSDAYQFSDVSTPLMADAELSIYTRNVTNITDLSKLYISDGSGRYYGGDYRDGWVSGRINELAGQYAIAYDDQAPIVSPLTVSGHRLLLTVTDAASGIDTWTASVDGRFIVFDAIEKSSTYACELRESWLRPTGHSHRLRFSATDNCHNTRIYDTTFVY